MSAVYIASIMDRLRPPGQDAILVGILLIAAGAVLALWRFK